jgi:hypothetical protein
MNNQKKFGVRARSNIANSGQAHKFKKLAQAFSTAMARHDYTDACAAAKGALNILPQHMGVLADYALCLMRLGRYVKAHEVYLSIFHAAPALQAQASTTWLDGLTEASGWLGLREDVRRYGKMSLERADARHGQSAWYVPATMAPPVFQPDQPQRNIIAYTLFGDSPRYCESAIANVTTAAQLFPHWRCRIYLDDSVPVLIQKRLVSAGAQVIDMSGSAQDGVHPLMWRFLVVDDPNVDRYLIRDADSLLSEREQVAVEQWLESPFWFHHIRDYFSHTELILAGLWGGCRGALPPLKPLMKAWLTCQTDINRFADQIFLREQVWSTLRRSVLCHDEWFDFCDARPFPAHPQIRWQTDRFHVGSNASFQAIRGNSLKCTGDHQEWVVLNREGTEICRYRSKVKDGKWSANLPFFITEPLTSELWRVELID